MAREVMRNEKGAPQIAAEIARSIAWAITQELQARVSKGLGPGPGLEVITRNCEVRVGDPPRIFVRVGTEGFAVVREEKLRLFLLDDLPDVLPGLCEEAVRSLPVN